MFETKEEFKQLFIEKLESHFGKRIEHATDREAYLALGLLIKEKIGQKWIETNSRYFTNKNKQVYYFSMEFLMGRLLGNNLLNLDILNTVETGLQELGFSRSILEEQEPDAGLGNGGLGRLAACFLDSLASLGMAGHGMGIRYKYGMFEQRFIEGNQIELPENWLSENYVWEVRREEESVEVKFGGVVSYYEDKGYLRFDYSDHEQLRAVPYDVPVVGNHNDTVNTLRLWSAEPTEDDLLLKAKTTNSYGDFLSHQRSLEAISDFLYPDDSNEEGKLLRLKQEYFLVSSGVQYVTQSFERLGLPWRSFSDHIALHINDTHPALVIPELMRILMDEKRLGWDEAWAITQKTVSYTNHTTLREALETWPVEMVRHLLPRIYMIIEEMNERFCKELWEHYPGDFNRIAQLAIIADGQIKMAHLSIVGSYSVNGVAQLHTEILKKHEMKAFYDVYPSRFNNKTNGISHRRWLMHANPFLSNLITEAIGDSWKREPERLENLLAVKDDPQFLDALFKVKQQNKDNLANWISSKAGIQLDPSSIFDVQIKRLHGYKRQLLNALHILHLYQDIKNNRGNVTSPRTFIFGAKAAPGYYFAKRVIKLINTIAQMVNNDPEVNEFIKVVFLENYAVSLAERIIPAANISEQISTASKEASGTGNMKLMMNGAVTLGTMDGANVEILQAVGQDHIYTFGLSADEVRSYYKTGHYSASELYQHDPMVREAVDQLKGSSLSKSGTEFQDLFNTLLYQNDEYFVLKDLRDYIAVQRQIGIDYQNTNNWSQSSLVNIARSGRFSSDLTIQSYATDIWELGALMVN